MDHDTIRGLLWGVAVGDALGAPHEFRTGTPLRQYTGILEYPLVVQSRWQGRRAGVVGQVSDDTEMTLSLASSLASAKRYSTDAALAAYMKWANSKCPFMGTNTRSLFHNVTTRRGYETRFNKAYGTSAQDTWSQSNGCLMRCAPLAVLGDKASDAARVDCALSNPHPICVDSCQVYIRAIQSLGAGAHLGDVEDSALEWAQTPEVKAALREASDLSAERDVTVSKGWVLHALWCAFRALHVLEDSGTYEDAIDWVVRLGGDTDTNACIAGGFLGAYLGYQAMASEERTGRNIKTARAADPTLGEIGRPAHYHAAKIDQAAKDLFALS